MIVLFGLLPSLFDDNEVMLKREEFFSQGHQASLEVPMMSMGREL